MARVPVRILLVLIMLVVLVASLGCLVRRRKIDRGVRPNAPLLTAGVEQLMEVVKQQYQAIETLNATVDLEPALLSTSKGEVSEYKDVRGYILLRKPAWIRVIGLYPVVRGTAFDMVSDGQTFRLYLPGKSLFLIGQNRIEKPSPKKLENLRPEHLLQALVIRPPDGSTERAVLESWSEAGTPSYIMHVIQQHGPGGLKLARNIWFDRATLEISRQNIFDEHGDVVTDARYGEWERQGNVSFPKHIIITRPKDEYELSIRFQKSVFNEPIGQDKFNLQQPPGVKVEYVGETKKPAGGGSGG